MEPRDLHALARRRANAKFGFLIHLAAFIGVNLTLYAINAAFAPQLRWSAFPLAGWAIGLAIHGLVVLPGGAVADLRCPRENGRLRDAPAGGAAPA